MSLENKLLRAINSNNPNKIESVFEEIYYEYGKLVGFIISKYIPKKEDIEELVDDVFVSFSKAMMKTTLTNIKYYLVTQAKNMSINFLNKKENKIEMVYDDLYISNNTYIQSKYYELIYEMKKVLTDKEINIILLRTIYNYSFDDISKKLNIPLQSIASVYKRAIKKFNKGVM